MIEDIIKFVKDWCDKNQIPQDVDLNDMQIAKFVNELQVEIAKMNFSVPEGTTIIAYSGFSNGNSAYEIAKQASENSGESVTYIKDLLAGELLNNLDFSVALEEVLGEENANKILHGTEPEIDPTTGKVEWVRKGNNSGFGENLLTLDDFVSAKMMGGSVGASNNIIVLIPEKVNPLKVFATTELEQILANDTFKYINGIPKEELRTIYDMGENGKQALYSIIETTAKEAVGDSHGIAV